MSYQGTMFDYAGVRFIEVVGGGILWHAYRYNFRPEAASYIISGLVIEDVSLNVGVKIWLFLMIRWDIRPAHFVITTTNERRPTRPVIFSTA